MGLGPIGQGIARLVLETEGLKLVGAADVSKDKAGKDLGVVLGLPKKLRVKVAGDLGRFLRKSRADVAILSTSSSLREVKPLVAAVVQRGMNVVTTCEELVFPAPARQSAFRELERLARAKRVSVLGAGVNPGFAMDKLVLTLATACLEITHVRVRRVVDAGRRRLALQKKIGAGLTVEEFRAQVAAGALKHHGLPESAAMVADALGWRLEQMEETIDPVLATQPLRSETAELPAGRVAGIRQRLRALVQGEERLCLELEMYVGAPEPVDTVSIRGLPDLTLTIPGGIHGDLATAAIVVNCIPALLEAKPGLRTARDIPMSYFPGLLSLG